MQNTRRIVAIVNRFSLVLNSVLFVFLIVLCLGPGGCLGRARTARLAQADARTLGQGVYVARPPFVILVSKDFPRDDSFTMLHHAAPVFVQGTNESADGLKLKEVALGVGEGFSVSCRYSLPSGEPDVREIMLIRTRKDVSVALTDFNGDGMSDFRQTRDLKNKVSRAFVWYEGEWRQIRDAQEDPSQERYRKRLLGGQRVSFDAESGKWVAEKPQTTP